jgi:hypothetical protein
MAHERPERRTALRYPVEAKVTVHKDGGGSIAAMASNISSAGMLLRVERPSDVREGERVTVEVELPADPGAPFSLWGAATVVRIDASMCAVHLGAGTFAGGDDRSPA